ncbi:PREDICTED: xenotropic and polytropic retrovirus receptor 1 homolog [Priapulus caudatus]|uniref:Xenotropic and polytropic retrovirus receptor 1 homolog n=1 Tax=Priapulus caudatus TaxID=37621 RepID=A0ABM1EGE2_PRICU|nr:PREDICTED: xenotropic and polytropic retrovirus receptor 1 homolog [Priapulus caudatus]
MSTARTCMLPTMLKDLLYAAQDEAPNADAVDDDHVQRFLANFEERFFRKSDQELVKINTFFSEKLAEAHRKWANLKSELGELEERDRNHVSGHQRRKLSSVVQRAKNKKEPAVRNLPQLKLAFSEFYLSLILLQNYQQLNFTGFRKILKKHDKLMQTETGSQWKSVNVASAHFYINKDIDRLIQETEVGRGYYEAIIPRNSGVRPWHSSEDHAGW